MSDMLFTMATSVPAGWPAAASVIALFGQGPRQLVKTTRGLGFTWRAARFNSAATFFGLSFAGPLLRFLQSLQTSSATGHEAGLTTG